jgi:nitrous oxide reductase
MASTASSILLFTKNFENPKYKAPATNPITMLAQISTTEHPGVIATSPDKQPFIVYCKLNETSPVIRSTTMVDRNSVMIHPAEAERVKLMAACGTMR